MLACLFIESKAYCKCWKAVGEILHFTIRCVPIFSRNQLSCLQFWIIFKYVPFDAQKKHFSRARNPILAVSILSFSQEVRKKCCEDQYLKFDFERVWSNLCFLGYHFSEQCDRKKKKTTKFNNKKYTERCSGEKTRQAFGLSLHEEVTSLIMTQWSLRTQLAG